MSRLHWLILFRTAFIIAFAFTTYCAFVKVDESPIEIVFDINDKILHLTAFMVLCGLLDYSFPAKRLHPAKWLFLFAYGISIEWYQSYLPWREASVSDLVADSLGLALYAGLQTRLKNWSWLNFIHRHLFTSESTS